MVGAARDIWRLVALRRAYGLFSRMAADRAGKSARAGLGRKNEFETCRSGFERGRRAVTGRANAEIGDSPGPIWLIRHLRRDKLRRAGPSSSPFPAHLGLEHRQVLLLRLDQALAVDAVDHVRIVERNAGDGRRREGRQFDAAL